ncbi:MAG: serine/threonine-protein kinase [Candidatus Sumerlaeia bacterium]|nr:serine/threonine-protein kinase [Candidatus Sumerlaeia bacterium]
MPPPDGDARMPSIGDRLGSYVLTGILGSGGMGRVYEAHDESLERDAAVKVISSAIASDPASRERIRIEARSAAKLHHPNIVSVFAFGEEGGASYIAMERVKGSSLQTMIASHGPMDPAKALRVVRDVAEALAYAWEHGIIHRDIKPANIMIDGRGTAKVLDFGLAKDLLSADPKLTATNTVMGTPLFMAPEQASGQPVDFRADMYSLGITLYYVVLGVVPYNATSPLAVALKHAQEDLPVPPTLEVLLKGELLRILRRMTVKRPEGRYAGYQELIADIDRVLGGGKSAPAPVRAAAPARPSKRWVWPALAGAAAVVAAVAYIATRDDKPLPPLEPITRPRTASATGSSGLADGAPAAEVIRLPETTPTPLPAPAAARPQEGGRPPGPGPQRRAPNPPPFISNVRELLAGPLRQGDFDGAIARIDDFLSRARLDEKALRFYRDVRSWLVDARAAETVFQGATLAERQQAAIASALSPQASQDDVVRALRYLTATGSPLAPKAFHELETRFPAAAGQPRLFFEIQSMNGLHEDRRD